MPQPIIASLDQLAADISAETKPIQNKPFIVFHDAYQYFETRFGLVALSAAFPMSRPPPLPPSA